MKWLLVAILAVFSCSAPDGGTCSGALTIPPEMTCLQCMEVNCGPTVAACNGPDWASNHYAGRCAPFTACQCLCTVRDTDCDIGCEPDKSVDCAACLDQIAACEDASCHKECGVPDPGSGDGGI